MKKWLILLSIMAGVGVGVVSLYMASLSGVMGKMGLYGGDFTQSIKVNELARQFLAENDPVQCGGWQVGKHIFEYLFSQGKERVRLAQVQGGERIVCGVRQVQDGNTERGVYTILKGLYYLKSHYTQMRILVEADRAQCVLLPNPEYERWVEGYLMATEGRVHDVVFELYKEVEGLRVRVEELCID